MTTILLVPISFHCLNLSLLLLSLVPLNSIKDIIHSRNKVLVGLDHPAQSHNVIRAEVSCTRIGGISRYKSSNLGKQSHKLLEKQKAAPASLVVQPAMTDTLLAQGSRPRPRRIIQPTSATTPFVRAGSS